nr:NADH dehydrogenase subunit 2 [Micranisa ralianga]
MCKNYYNYVLFMPMMLATNVMILFSSSWFSMWMIMEINLISFISLIMFDKNINTEVLMNYFLIQTYNSFIFMFSMILLNYLSNDFIFFLMNLSMLMKLGMPPMYMWYLKIMNNLNWMHIFLLSTIQKFIPLIILNNIMFMNKSILMNLIIILSFSMYIAIKGMKTMNLKLMMAYSSIIQLSWIIITMMINEMLGFCYYFLYMLISFNMMVSFYQYNLKFLMNINMFKLKKKNNMYMYYFSILSLASLPPMMGFLMKLLSLQILSNYLSFFLLIIMILSSLTSMFFYLRILFNMMMIYSMSMKMNFKFMYIKDHNNYKILYSLWLLIMLMMLYEMM